jgi:hypothetical protein
LYPSRRTQYIRHNWKKEWQKPTFQNIKKLWEVYREISEINLSMILLYELVLSENLDNFDLIARNLNKLKRPASQDEYKNYIAKNTIKISYFSLSWWLLKSQRERLTKRALTKAIADERRI